MPNPVKSLGYMKCDSLSSPDLLKVYQILSYATVRRSAVDQEDLKPYRKSEKVTSLKVINNPIIYKFLKALTKND